jgi:diguanylate cyclase (GGDEF)-like protein
MFTPATQHSTNSLLNFYEKNSPKRKDMTDAISKNRRQPLEVSNIIINQWQEMVDSLAKVMDVRAVLIMRLNHDKIEVFRTSNSVNNPYKLQDSEDLFDSGLYCGRVIKTGKKLYVPDVIKDEDWKDNPDIALNMISYLGFPINNEDSTPFGSLCLLHDSERVWSEVEEDIIVQFRNMIENHLKLTYTLDKISALNESLENMVYYDDLTNIYNRKYFLKVSEDIIAIAKRDNKSVSVVMIDIDNFKYINDEFGNSAGDEVLVSLSQKITHRIRDSDIFARFGGEEFILLLQNTDAKSAFLLSEHIRKIIEDTVVSDMRITISLGVSQMDIKNDSLDDVIKKSDKALFEAKKTGKNKVCIK